MAKLGFNASEVDPSSGGNPLPPAEYELQVIEEELGPNAKGTGDLLKLTYEVLGPDQIGRRIWVNVNVTHNNPVAQKIGQEELSALCHATGQMEVDDTEELLWKPFRAITKIDIDKGTGKERAAIKKYLFGDALNAPAEKSPPTRPAAPAARPSAVTRPAATSRPAANARPGAAPAEGRTLPWKDRQAAAARAAAQAAALDDDIPF